MKHGSSFPRASAVRARAKLLFFGLALACFLAWPILPADAAPRTWLGNTSLWSNPGNWSPSGVPQNGDALTFPDISPFGVVSMNNDLANLSLDTITFTAGGYLLNGNTITFIQGITDNHVGTLNRVNCGIQFTSGGGRFNSIDLGQLEISGTTTLAGNQDLIVTSLETNITVSGVIQGNGGLILRGSGRLFLRGSGANTFTGPTHIEGGAAHLAKTSAARAISANVFIGENPNTFGSLYDDLAGQYPSALSVFIGDNGHWSITNGVTVTNLTIYSPGFIDGEGLLNLNCDVEIFHGEDFFVSYTGIDCSMFLGSQTRTFHFNSGPVIGHINFFIDGQIIGPGPGAGSPGIIKSGGSDMYLDRPNLYYGPTTVQGGSLWIVDSAALGGSGAGAETRVEGGVLGFTGLAAPVPEPIIMQGGDIEFYSSTMLTGSLVLSNGCSFTGQNDTAFLEISSVISGPQAFSVEGGTVRLSGSSANTFGSAFSRVFVRTGPLFDFYPSIPTLELAKAGVAAVPVPVTVSAFDTNVAVLRQLQDGGVSDVTISHGGSWQINGHTAAPAALTFTGDGYVDTQGGLLQLTNPGTNQLRVISSSPTNYVAGISGRLSCLSPTNIIVVESNLTLNVAARVSGGAEIVKEGLGTLRLSSSNSFTGPFTVNEGRLTAAHAFALGTTAAGTFVNGNASLAMDGGFNGIEIADETLTLNSTNPAAFASINPVTNVWSGSINLQRTAGIEVSYPLGALIHSGLGLLGGSVAISGPGGFTKSGPGALIITGLIGGNSYTGPTTITDGSLEATRRPGRSLSSNIVVTGVNSILRTGHAGTLFNSALTVLPTGSSVTVQDGALWIMNPTNSETVSRLTGDGRVDIGSGATLTASNSVSCVFSGVVSNTGALNKRGLATLNFTGQSPSYTGPVTVFDGTYKVDGYFANSPVSVKLSSILRGSGAVGDVTVENGGAVRVDPASPGYLGGAMQFNSVNFQTGGVLAAGFFGPDPTGGNDFLYVLNGVTLNSSALSIGFQYPPREGDVVTLVQKIASGAVSGTFSSFAAGTVRNIGQIPVVISYVGGNGNDVTLTVTNLPLGGGGSQLVSGTGSSVFVPNDCNLLSLFVTNRSGVVISHLHGTLRSLTPGVTVTIPESDFPDLAPAARGTNRTPFQIRTGPAFPCGGGAQFELVLTAPNTPPIAIDYALPGASGYHLDFDGRDDEVDVAANAFSSVVNNFTIELWVNPAGNRTQTAETNNGISGVSVPLHQAQRFAVFPDRGDLAYGLNHVGAGLSIGRNGISAYEQGTNYLPSRLVYSNAVSGWTHVALVYASRAPKLYVNGTLVRSGSAGPFPNVHPSASLGGSTQASYGNFEGQLDEVRIWNVALSQSQIQSNMTQRLTGTEAGLVTYFRCDEASGSVLTDSASASPNPNGTLANGAAFVLSDRGPFTVPGGPACDSGGGACESCFVVSGTFTTKSPTLPARLSAVGPPSVCFPAKLCPGAEATDTNNPPTRYYIHSFANTSGTQACVTAQLHFLCPVAPEGALHAAAYLGSVDTNDPCQNYLGDSGGDGTQAFSFPVPAGSNVVILVTKRIGDIGCDDYQLELFGLNCPPPRLDIEREAQPDKVRVHWSTAYPGWQLQSVSNLSTVPPPFQSVPIPPVMAGGRYNVTNDSSGTNQFYRLFNP
jgi:autotransporter-associated beta strand protein